jgi:hypothetical protein
LPVQVATPPDSEHAAGPARAGVTPPPAKAAKNVAARNASAAQLGSKTGMMRRQCLADIPERFDSPDIIAPVSIKSAQPTAPRGRRRNCLRTGTRLQDAA